MYQRPYLNEQHKAENWRAFPKDDRLRCHVCRGIYWRLWDNVAQCMSCRSYTGLVTEGPTGTLRDVEWINFALTEHNDGYRVRDPVSGRAEWVIFKNKLRSRMSEQELELKPQLAGSWLMAKIEVMPKKVMENKEAIVMIKKSTALRNRKIKRNES